MHFGSEFLAHWRQKCYRNPFLGHFETPKEYGRHCHSYLGKVKFFRVNWITKMYQKRNFSLGRAESAPPLPLVGLTYIFNPPANRVNVYFPPESNLYAPFDIKILIFESAWNVDLVLLSQNSNRISYISTI